MAYSKNQDTVKVLTGYAMQKCGAHKHLCAITSSVIDQNTICAEKAFRKQTTNTLKRTCKLREMENDDRLPLIQEIGYREFIITAIKKELYVAHENNVSKKVDINRNIPGSYPIKIACSSKLIQINDKGSVTLIHHSTPCFEKDQKLEILRVIADQWCAIPESIIQKTLDSKHKFASINKIFDKKQLYARTTNGNGF